MPTSNGQITARDIRQKSVKSLHIVDEAVTTSKIPDMAVTFPDKIDNPIWSATFSENAFTNETLNTTFQTFKDADIAIPAWVDQVSILALGRFQMTNTSGGDQTAYPGIEIDGEVLGGATFEFPNNSTKSVMVADVANLTGVAGSTISITMEVGLSTGTNTANMGRIYGLVVGTR